MIPFYLTSRPGDSPKMLPFTICSENVTFFRWKIVKFRVIAYVSMYYINCSEKVTFSILAPKMLPFAPKMLPLTFLNFYKVLSISRLASRARPRLL